jgi:hypothetical protein
VSFTDHPFSDLDYSWTDEDGNQRCGRYSSKRHGGCDTPLDERGECPRQGDHGWSNEVRGS